MINRIKKNNPFLFFIILSLMPLAIIPLIVRFLVLYILPSCYFRPTFMILSLLLLSCCSPQTPEEFRSEGRREQRKLIECLSHIQNEEQLAAAKPELAQLFKEWGDLICAVHQFRRSHPDATAQELTDEDYSLNDQLKQEMRRICQLRGGEEALAEAEKAGITRLKRL